MVYASLLEAFETLSERKRENPKGLSPEEHDGWKQMRNQIERALFTQTPASEADRREHLRAPVSLSARYWTSSEMTDRYISVMGEGGLFIPTDDPLPVGSEIDLEMVLVNQTYSLRVKGEVVWVNRENDTAKRGMGIKFVELTYEQKAAIYDLVHDSVREHLLERRQFARIDIRLPAQFRYSEGAFLLPTEDISLGGAFVATDYLVMQGEQVEMVLKLSRSLPRFRAQAQVTRVVETALPGLPAGIGLIFTDMRPQSKKGLLDYLIRRVAGNLKPPGMNSEHRCYPRVKRRIQVQFQSSGREGTSYCRDISRGGAFIQTHEPPSVWAEIDLSFKSPANQQVLALPGQVVRVVGPNPALPHRVPGAGVVFSKVSNPKRKLLREFLKEFVLSEKTAPTSG